MPILKEVKLILVDAKEIEFMGDKNEPIKKWKYTFLQEDGTLKVGYDSNGIYKDDVKTVKSWDSAKAQNYFWELTEFQGITREKLFVGQLPKVK